jgi:hypothetical protein
MSSTQYYGGPLNPVFETQTKLTQLKCKMDDLQTIVNKISPGSVPITNPNQNSSSSSTTLPLSATDVTWFDPVTGDKLSVQEALQTTNTCVSSLESG